MNNVGEATAPHPASPGWVVPATELRGPIAGAVLLVVLASLAYAYRGVILSALPAVLADVRTWLAIMPGCFILHHAAFLRFQRRHQFVTALEPLAGDGVSRWGTMADSYFGVGTLAIRYIIPALLATVFCWFALDVLASPAAGSFSWLHGTEKTQQILRGARFGFAGAYLYTIILLAQRGFRRDITSGVAMWAAALFVLGPLSGSLAALLVSGVVGTGEGTFVGDTVFVFAGMLPREFAHYLQNSARRMLQPAAAIGLRNMPISVLRGSTPAIEERFAEQGIEDAGALAYASPFQLVRSTSYDTKQIVQWIDESLLMATLPDLWQDLEKAGITGAIDLAWCHDKPEVLTKLADVTKMDLVLLTAVAQRFEEDAQVSDLRCFYWTEPPPVSVSFETLPEVSPEDQDAIAKAVAPSATVRKQGPVVVLRKVASKDRGEVQAGLALDRRVKQNSFRVLS